MTSEGRPTTYRSVRLSWHYVVINTEFNSEGMTLDDLVFYIFGGVPPRSKTIVNIRRYIIGFILRGFILFGVLTP